MTKDWRKELGLENVDYKWQMDNRFKVPDEVYFVHELTVFFNSITAMCDIVVYVCWEKRIYCRERTFEFRCSDLR